MGYGSKIYICQTYLDIFGQIVRDTCEVISLGKGWSVPYKKVVLSMRSSAEGTPGPIENSDFGNQHSMKGNSVP
jgi:hypothetical protein